MKPLEIRKRIIHFGKKMLEDGLTSGTGGNISFSPSGKDHLYISPSGIPYEDISPDQVPRVNYSGDLLDSGTEPSSETPMHTMIHRSKNKVNAIIHTHSPFASTIAAIGKRIPPIHYQIANIGDEVPLADYATYGTEEIARSVTQALGDENGVLLEKHGALAVGKDLESAYKSALLIEKLAEIYYRVLSTDYTADTLEDSELQLLKTKFQEYGQENG